MYNKNSGICFEGETAVKPAQLNLTRKDLDIPEEITLFITGANFYKLTWELREFWAKLLLKIPNTYLIVFPFGPAWTNKYPVKEFIQSIKEQYIDVGVNHERLVILKPLPTREDVRKIVGMADIYLDSFPYSGATSLLDPLYTNLPMISMKTDTVRGGQGSGMLEDIGLDELVVNTKEEYIALAEKLVNDVEYRKEISLKIEKSMNNNPAFLDTYKYAKDMEKIYMQMLDEYNDNENSVTVKDSDNKLLSSDKKPVNLKPNDICYCGSGLKFKKCCGK